MSDTFTPEKRSDIMRQVKSKNSKIEQKVRSALWRLGYRFIKHDPNLPGKPDVIFRGANLVIFIDSCFWHGCSKHCRMPISNSDYWENKINRNIKRDKEVNEKYRNNKWQSVRIWEHTIKQDFDNLILELQSIINCNYCKKANKENVIYL